MTDENGAGRGCAAAARASREFRGFRRRMPRRAAAAHTAVIVVLAVAASVLALVMMALVMMALVTTRRRKEPRTSGRADRRALPAPKDGIRGGAQTSKMPRIVHQSWKTAELPHRFALWSRTVRDLNPEWSHRLWTDADNRALVAEHFPRFLPTYDGYNHFIKRADAARAAYLWVHGGLYLDLDFEAVRPIGDLFENDLEGDVVIGRMSRCDEGPYAAHCLPNALMASVPRCDFWLHVIDVMRARANRGSPEYDTGPIMLRDAVATYKGRARIVIADPAYFYPLDWGQMLVEGSDMQPWRTPGEGRARHFREKDPRTRFATYWTHSWG